MIRPFRRDPFWDDGEGARRTQRRVRLEGFVALAIAIVACGVTAALWLRTLSPLMDALGLY
jgi:fructose-1,6-bisphosphatase/inositol monophosphatase family enzyme